VTKPKVDIHEGKLGRKKRTYDEEQALRRTQKGIFEFKGEKKK